MNAMDNDHDIGFLNFRPYRVALQGSCEVRIPLTDSEIWAMAEANEDEEDEDEKRISRR